MFLAGSLPPVSDDISYMIGSYGIISRRNPASPSAPPERGAAKTRRPLAAHVGFTSSIDGSEPHAICLDNNNGKDGSESAQSSSDDESSDSYTIELASGYGSDVEVEGFGSAGNASPARPSVTYVGCTHAIDERELCKDPIYINNGSRDPATNQLAPSGEVADYELDQSTHDGGMDGVAEEPRYKGTLQANVAVSFDDNIG